MLFAPGLATRQDIVALVHSVDRPVNVVMGLKGVQLSLAELSDIGVTRVGRAHARSTFAADLRWMLSRRALPRPFERRGGTSIHERATCGILRPTRMHVHSSRPGAWTLLSGCRWLPLRDRRTVGWFRLRQLSADRNAMMRCAVSKPHAWISVIDDRHHTTRYTLSVVFRWSVWGDKRRFADTLPYSIGTFQRAFGSDARYVVSSDSPHELRPLLGESIELISHGAPGTGSFNLDTPATWRKWCPTPRVAPDSTEFYVDADVFLTGEPSELRRFSGADASPHSLLVMQEAAGSPYYVGRFGSRILTGIPPVNTGLLGQRAGVDITDDLTAELRWWLEHVPANRRTFHDEQGAVVAVLSRRYLLGQVALLPQDRYRVVSPGSNAALSSLDGITAIHATHPTHPAFHRFKPDIVAFAAGGSCSTLSRVSR